MQKSGQELKHQKPKPSKNLNSKRLPRTTPALQTLATTRPPAPTVLGQKEPAIDAQETGHADLESQATQLER
ncbi:unnamed protein product [Acanthoscelides obtectus]|uniref:Uncharacterized protein n=1 Tax=Acanthoscelides obtectus TaxID=200917 RepID=A0A9P0Q404_ACAOB|nr:unnamed protein product [Acanthoscelides obtectus]CAK1663630.1 hypothetical protein AOBTE_LOCUS23757 [Acanthoscelides obtectus]